MSVEEQALGLLQQGNYRTAEKLLKKSIKENERNFPVYFILSELYRREQNWVQAEAILKEALLQRNNHPVAWCNLGVIYQQQGAYQQAREALLKALHYENKDPVAHFFLGMNLLLHGEFTQGWQEHAWRRFVPQEKFSKLNLPLPVWQGQAITDATLYVVGEQGLGDNIQFVRYLRLLREQYSPKHLVLVCAGALHGIFKQSNVADAIEDNLKVPDTECYYIPIMDLPMVFATELNTIPNQVPYLNISDLPKLALTLPKTKPLIGLVWKGKASHTNDHNRSIPLHLFAEIFANEQYQFVSLQKDVQPDEKNLLREFDILNLEDELPDFVNTASYIEQLDLVVSIDSSVLHLTCALGKPAIALIPKYPDWRWLLERDDSPWYPTLTLLRQLQVGQWQMMMPLLHSLITNKLKIISG